MEAAPDPVGAGGPGLSWGVDMRHSCPWLEVDQTSHADKTPSVGARQVADPRGLDYGTAAAVELGACLGGLCFLVGTSLYWHGPVAGDPGCATWCPVYATVCMLYRRRTRPRRQWGRGCLTDCLILAKVLAMWISGSAAFTCGGLALAYRHAALGLT